MNKKFINIYLLLIFLFILHCGFKTVDKSNINDFTIQGIDAVGNKRINFDIKNNLMINSKSNSSNIIKIDIETKKTHAVKEKNIKNEITKHLVKLECNVSINLIKDGKKLNFNKIVVGDYLVAKSYSKTLNNEKKLIDNLVENLSEQIISELNLKLNDI